MQKPVHDMDFQKNQFGKRSDLGKRGIQESHTASSRSPTMFKSEAGHQSGTPSFPFRQHTHTHTQQAKFVFTRSDYTSTPSIHNDGVLHEGQMIDRTGYMYVCISQNRGKIQTPELASTKVIKEESLAPCEPQGQGFSFSRLPHTHQLKSHEQATEGDPTTKVVTSYSSRKK